MQKQRLISELTDLELGLGISESIKMATFYSQQVDALQMEMEKLNQELNKKEVSVENVETKKTKK